MERILVALMLSLTACSSATGDGDLTASEDTDGGVDGGAAIDPGACEGPLGKPVDPSTLAGCCEAYPGKAACFPMEKVPAELKTVVGKCADGAACIPNDFLRTGGVFKPKTCKSLGGPGVCLSRCIPMVEEKAALLPWDVCDEESERCVPCINPLDKKETGACKIEGRCAGEDAGPADTEPVDTGPPKCPHEGPPVIEPATFPACQCADAHCLPSAVVPAEMASKLTDCTAGGGKCVPDTLIASGGQFIPKTCKSVGGNEGRCLSTCLPDIQAQAAMLPQDTCGASEKCAPCWNPLDGTETGACKLSCDPGATTAYKPLPKCCGSRGTCVPKSAVPADAAKQLKTDGCPETEPMLCAPDAFLKKTWVRRDCDARTLLGDAGKGVCMPECINGLGFPLLKGSGCGDGEKCAPCLNPLTKAPTGACEFKP
jgi:hypothetical protein